MIPPPSMEFSDNASRSAGVSPPVRLIAGVMPPAFSLRAGVAPTPIYICILNIHVLRYVCMYVSYVCMYVCMYECVCVCVCVCVCIIRMHVCMYQCVCVCVCVCVPPMGVAPPAITLGVASDLCAGVIPPKSLFSINSRPLSPPISGPVMALSAATDFTSSKMDVWRMGVRATLYTYTCICLYVYTHTHTHTHTHMYTRTHTRTNTRARAHKNSQKGRWGKVLSSSHSHTPVGWCLCSRGLASRSVVP
jgi:hypothetical protein